MNENSFELGNEHKYVYAGDKKVNFYKLDKSKPHSAESEYGKAGYIAVFCIGCVLVVLLAILAGILRADLFADAGSVAVFSVFCAVAVFNFIIAIFAKRSYNKRNFRVLEILKDCTLTDGVVTEYSCVKRHTGSNDYVYDISLSYTFYDTDGNARSSVFSTTSGVEPPFYAGQNLMIAFNDSDSVIMKKFSLAEGAKEFSLAEADRLMLDFNSLGKPVTVDRRSVKGASYPKAFIATGAFFGGMWLVLFALITGFILAGKADVPFIILPCALSVFFLPEAVYFIVNGVKPLLKFKKIMKNPSFAQGEIFFPKTTYRGKSKEIFYRFIDKSGGRRIERISRFDKRDNFKDGNSVVIAYNGELSEVLSYYILKC